MGFLELAKKRFSVRSFKAAPVENEKLVKILTAGNIAPTAANRQPFKILVVQSKEGLKKVEKTAHIYGAPLIFIVCANHSQAWVRPFDNYNLADTDASIVTTHMMLAAADLDLGSLWIGYFNPYILCQNFNIKSDLTPLNLLAVGYNEGEALSPERHCTTRKNLTEIVAYEKIS